MDHARRFLDVAELAAGEVDGQDYASAAAARAVLAGIAASDAACCRALAVGLGGKITVRQPSSSHRSSREDSGRRPRCAVY